MEIVEEYYDEGLSGKNIKGRQEFMRMLNDIEDGKDGVDFVLVFKLSRFGRNAASDNMSICYSCKIRRCLVLGKGRLCSKSRIIFHVTEVR